METTETPQHCGGGIYNYFQGATINNLVINGNMTKSGDEHISNNGQTVDRSVRPELITKALRLCGSFIWGNAAYSIAFCVCRDAYKMGDNASLYERLMADNGIQIPAGTINTTMNRNPWMKYHIDRWEENGASDRALKLRDEFRRQIETLLLGNETPKQKCQK